MNRSIDLTRSRQRAWATLGSSLLALLLLSACEPAALENNEPGEQDMSTSDDMKQPIADMPKVDMGADADLPDKDMAGVDLAGVDMGKMNIFEPDDAAAIMAGQMFYTGDKGCSGDFCHGPDGMGTKDISMIGTQSDEYIFNAICFGGTGMSAYCESETAAAFRHD